VSKRKLKFNFAPIQLRPGNPRCKISPAKEPFLQAVQGIIERLENFLPLSLRQIHYQLLNHPPLIHASKPRSYYRNRLRSYAALVDLVTRARDEGLIDYETIDDETRSVTTWAIYTGLDEFYDEEMYSLLTGYARNLMQSQPNYLELLVEKNTQRHRVAMPARSRKRNGKRVPG
jgi:hypothetical protein